MEISRLYKVNKLITKPQGSEDNDKWRNIAEIKNNKRDTMRSQLEKLFGPGNRNIDFVKASIGEEKYTSLVALMHKSGRKDYLLVLDSAIKIMKRGERPHRSTKEASMLRNHFNGFSYPYLQNSIGLDKYTELVTLWFSTSRDLVNENKKQKKIQQWLQTSHLDYYDCLDSYEILKRTNDKNSIASHVLTMLNEEFNQVYNDDLSPKLLLGLFQENNNLKGYIKLKNLWSRTTLSKNFRKTNSKKSVLS